MDAQLKERCTITITQNIEMIAKAEEYKQEVPKTTQEVLETCDDQECKDLANYNLALEKKDLSYCNKIVDSDLKETCIRQQSEMLDQFYLRMATVKGDKSVCSKIINQSLRDLCNSN